MIIFINRMMYNVKINNIMMKLIEMILQQKINIVIVNFKIFLFFKSMTQIIVMI